MEDESSLTNEIREINQPRSAINKVLVQYIYIYTVQDQAARCAVVVPSILGYPICDIKKDNVILVGGFNPSEKY